VHGAVVAAAGVCVLRADGEADGETVDGEATRAKRLSAEDGDGSAEAEGDGDVVGIG
jgi:hypothetical protein